MIDLETRIEKQGSGGVLSFATVDKKGLPQVRSMPAVLFEPDAFCFSSARSKSFCRPLTNGGHVQIRALTKHKERIRLSAIAKPVPDNESECGKDIIFAGQPCIANAYPDNTRENGIIFYIRNARIEYFNPGGRPIERGYHAMSLAEPESKGFEITGTCVACGTCAEHCPQDCIEEGGIYHIQPERCLHCGSCFENGPVQANVPLE